MDLPVKQFMQQNVRTIRTIASNVRLPELEKAFLEQSVSGFPVVDKGELVGWPSRRPTTTWMKLVSTRCRL